MHVECAVANRGLPKAYRFRRWDSQTGGFSSAFRR